MEGKYRKYAEMLLENENEDENNNAASFFRAANDNFIETEKYSDNSDQLRGKELARYRRESQSELESETGRTNLARSYLLNMFKKLDGEIEKGKNINFASDDDDLKNLSITKLLERFKEVLYNFYKESSEEVKTINDVNKYLNNKTLFSLLNKLLFIYCKCWKNHHDQMKNALGKENTTAISSWPGIYELEQESFYSLIHAKTFYNKWEKNNNPEELLKCIELLLLGLKMINSSLLSSSDRDLITKNKIPLKETKKIIDNTMKYYFEKNFKEAGFSSGVGRNIYNKVIKKNISNFFGSKSNHMGSYNDVNLKFHYTENPNQSNDKSTSKIIKDIPDIEPEEFKRYNIDSNTIKNVLNIIFPGKNENKEKIVLLISKKPNQRETETNKSLVEPNKKDEDKIRVINIIGDKTRIFLYCQLDEGKLKNINAEELKKIQSIMNKDKDNNLTINAFVSNKDKAEVQNFINKYKDIIKDSIITKSLDESWEQIAIRRGIASISQYNFTKKHNENSNDELLWNNYNEIVNQNRCYEKLNNIFGVVDGPGWHKLLKPKNKKEGSDSFPNDPVTFSLDVYDNKDKFYSRNNTQEKTNVDVSTKDISIFDKNIKLSKMMYNADYNSFIEHVGKIYNSLDNKDTLEVKLNAGSFSPGSKASVITESESDLNDVIKRISDLLIKKMHIQNSSIIGLLEKNGINVRTNGQIEKLNSMLSKELDVFFNKLLSTAVSTSNITKKQQEKSNAYGEAINELKVSISKYFDTVRKYIEEKFNEHVVTPLQAATYLLKHLSNPQMQVQMQVQTQGPVQRLLQRRGSVQASIDTNASKKETNISLPKEVQEALKKVLNIRTNKKPSIRTFDDVKNLDRKTLKEEANNIRNRK